jgi:hypothetical protein
VSGAVGLVVAAALLQSLAEPTAPFTIEREPLHHDGPLTPVRVTLAGEFLEARVLEVLHLVAGRRDPSRWHLFARRTARRGDAIDLAGPPGTFSLLVFRDPSAPGYGLHGPFAWPAGAAALALAPSRARTVRARAPTAARLTSARWIPADGTLSTGVECRLLSETVLECLGLAVEEAGVVLAEDSADQHWSAPALRPTPLTTLHDLMLVQAPWGAMFQISPRPDSLERGPLEATLWRFRRSHTGRSRRLMLTPAPGYQAVWVTSGTLWIAGTRPEDDVLLQIAGAGVVTVRVALGPLRLNPSGNPIPVALDVATEVAGRVVAGDGRAVAGAVVTVSELVDEAGRLASSPAPGLFRLRLDEVATDDEGLFVVNGLGQREYEWLAMHPLLGRTMIVGFPDSPMTLRLESERSVMGRVTSGGEPLAGVPILILPLLEGLTASGDPLEHIGQEIRSDSAGRFRVPVPSRAAGDVRIGSNATGIVRRRVESGAGPSLIDLGDIELRRPSTVVVRLDGHDGCDMGAVGPLGRVGMQIIAANRHGPGTWRLHPPERGRWSLVATCAGKALTLEPATFEVTPDDDELAVHVVSMER